MSSPPTIFLIKFEKKREERHHITCFFVIRGTANGRISKVPILFSEGDYYFGKNNFNW
jgi:hypothetical protein